MVDGEFAGRDDRAAVDKAFAILRSLGSEAGSGVGVSEIARRTGLRKSTAFRLLGMMERNGVLERIGSAYRLGSLLDEIVAREPSEDREAVKEALMPYLVDLYEITRANVHLAVLDGTDSLCITKLRGHQTAPSPIRVGSRIPAYSTAVGKALLARDPRATADTMAMPRRRWTSTTLTEERDLVRELDQVRSNGIALDRGESLPHVSCIAMAVTGGEGRPIAAISVSGNTSSFPHAKFEHSLRLVAYHASRFMANRVQSVASAKTA